MHNITRLSSPTIYSGKAESSSTCSTPYLHLAKLNLYGVGNCSPHYANCIVIITYCYVSEILIIHSVHHILLLLCSFISYKHECDPSVTQTGADIGPLCGKKKAEINQKDFSSFFVVFFSAGRLPAQTLNANITH